MKKQTLTIFGILIFFISCKQVESKKIKESETKEIEEIEEIKETKKEEKSQTELISAVDLYFENDSITSSLKSNLEKIVLDPKFMISKKPIKNRHVDNLVDTIMTRSFKNTELTSYKAESEEWVYKAKIRDSDFELNDFIKIGTEEYIVEKSLSKGIHNDTLIIGNLEQTSIFNLIFESGILKSIEYEGYVD